MKSIFKKAPQKAKEGPKESKFFKVFVPFLVKAMPYLLAVLFTVLLFCFAGWAGNFGRVVGKIFHGIFSNFCSYFVLIIILYHSLMWYHDINEGICTRRVICSNIIVVCISALQHLISAYKNPFLKTASIKELYIAGADENLGGGVIGGIVGNLLLKLGTFFAFAIVLVLLLFMLLQTFNITPKELLKNLFARKKSPEKFKNVERTSNPFKKHKNFDVFDDEDEEDKPVKAEPVSPTEDEDEGTFVSEKDFTVQNRPIATEYVRSSFGNNAFPNSSQLKSFEDYQKESHRFDFTPSPIPTVERPVSPSYYDAPESETTEFELSSPSFDSTETKEQSSFQEDLDIRDCVSPDVFKKIQPKVQPVEEFEDTDEIEEEFEPYRKSVEPVAIPAKEPEEKKGFFSIFKKKEETEKAFSFGPYTPPPLDLLAYDEQDDDEEEIAMEAQENAKIIVNTLNSFNTKTRIEDIVRGPSVTRYELQPEDGVKVKSILGLSSDIALKLAAEEIRIEAPVPGKNAIGIEVPNKTCRTVYLKELISEPGFINYKGGLLCAVGMGVAGEKVYIDLTKMPHLLVAGATGMGKSVCVNVMLASLLYKYSPSELRIILIDPKQVEFSSYNGIPHLLVPTVCDPKKALGAFQWAVEEMEKRFTAMSENGSRNISEYNAKVPKEDRFPTILIVIDELNDLKMAEPGVDTHITRLTQKARAANIHVIVATQRPSVDVITGVIKSNLPARISLRVASLVDSRTILDEVGAEKLVCRGDMLLKCEKLIANGNTLEKSSLILKPFRVQGALIKTEELETVIDFIKENSEVHYDEDVMARIDANAQKLAKNDRKNYSDGDEAEEDSNAYDEKFYEALGLVVENGKASSSMLSMYLSIGFQRSNRILMQLEEAGYIGPANGMKPREVLIDKSEYDEIIMRYQTNND